MVALENRLGWPGEGRTRPPLPLNCAPPQWPAKREYKAVPAIADKIWRYRTGEEISESKVT